MSLDVLALILGSVVLSVSGQTYLKLGMAKATKQQMAGPVEVLTGALLSRGVWLGTSCYLVGVVLWLLVLSRVDLSVAYPVGGMTHIGVVLVSWLFLGELVTPRRWLGVFVICLGIVIVAGS